MKPIALPRWAVEHIEQEASAAYPEECCGILIGRDEADQRVIVSLERVRNAFDPAERGRRFSIAPETLLKVERTAEKQGLTVVGFYHSHPDHPARPSEVDREHGWPFYSYVIVSLAGGDPVDMTSWILDDTNNTFSRQNII